jgi:hypothetical protein
MSEDEITDLSACGDHEVIVFDNCNPRWCDEVES